MIGGLWKPVLVFHLLNGKLRLKKSAIGGARWYEIRVGRVKYGIEGGVSSGARYFTISKR